VTGLCLCFDDDEYNSYDCRDNSYHNQIPNGKPISAAIIAAWIRSIRNNFIMTIPHNSFPLTDGNARNPERKTIVCRGAARGVIHGHGHG
jgi:hypothetical protein